MDRRLGETQFVRPSIPLQALVVGIRCRIELKTDNLDDCPRTTTCLVEVVV